MCFRLQQDTGKSTGNARIRGLPNSLQGYHPAKSPAGVPMVLLSSIEMSFEYGFHGDRLRQGGKEFSLDNSDAYGIFDTSDFERELDDLEQGNERAQEMYRLFGVAFQNIITPAATTRKSAPSISTTKSLAELAPAVFSLRYQEVSGPLDVRETVRRPTSTN